MDLYNRHRYSMPTARPRNGQYETSLDGANITRFLFDDEDSGGASHGNSNPNTSDERFPTLVRRDDQMVSEHFHCFSPLVLSVMQ